MAYGSGGSSAAELVVEGAYPIEFLCASRVVSKPDPPVRCVGRGTPVSCALSSGHFISSSVILGRKSRTKSQNKTRSGDRCEETEKNTQLLS